MNNSTILKKSQIKNLSDDINNKIARRLTGNNNKSLVNVDFVIPEELKLELTKKYSISSSFPRSENMKIQSFLKDFGIVSENYDNYSNRYIISNLQIRFRRNRVSKIKSLVNNKLVERTLTGSTSLLLNFVVKHEKLSSSSKFIANKYLNKPEK